jgi:hypothetical protein
MCDRQAGTIEMSMLFYGHGALDDLPVETSRGFYRLYVFFILSFMAPFAMINLHHMAQIRGFIPGATFVRYPVTKLWTTSDRYGFPIYNVAWDAGARSAFATATDCVDRQCWDTLRSGSPLEVACFPQGRDAARSTIAADTGTFAFFSVICLLELGMIGYLIHVIILTRQEAVRAIAQRRRDRERLGGREE